MSKYLSRDFLRKLDQTVYEKAAVHIQKDYNVYSCIALENVEPNVDHRHLHAYRAAFQPVTAAQYISHPYWNKDALSRRTLRRRKRERINALLMMAEMVRYAKAH